MKKQVVAQPLMLMGVCALAVVLMGGGTECPKLCVVEGAACETYCQSGLNGVCVLPSGGSVLECRLTKPEECGCNRCSAAPGIVSGDSASSWLLPILLVGLVAFVRRLRLQRRE